MASSVFCDVDVPDWVVKDCGVENAGIIAVGLIDPSESPSKANLESKAYWTGRIAASPQNFFLVQPTRGEYPGGTPTEEDGFGTEVSRVTGADHSVTFEVEGLKDNRDFWEAANRKSWKTVYFTNAGYFYYVTTPATLYGTIDNKRSIKTAAFWKVVTKWQSYDNPIIGTTPSALLDAN